LRVTFNYVMLLMHNSTYLPFTGLLTYKHL